MSEEYVPQIYMAIPAGAKKVDCYFTNGAVRRYDVIYADGVSVCPSSSKAFT